ncbi:MAG: ribonuclease HII [Alphaproteobacteria bacterium]|nr:ribonuclease HII [Alphaproteobacteria bacterium]
MARLYALPIAGIDEAGRGPWAGPVVAAAVTLDLAWTPPDDLNDSKQITEARRGELFALIQSGALGFGIGIATHQEIDALNIRRATHLAMTRAMEALRAQGCAPRAALVDGNDPPAFDVPTRALVQGDGRSFSVAAASILAKVTRDRMMAALDAEHPGYGFARHKGYGTPHHAEALLRLGPCAIHRRSFSPVASAARDAAEQAATAALPGPATLI